MSDIEQNRITVCGPDGNKLTNTVQYFLQELSLGTLSSIFNHVLKTPGIPLRDAAVVYLMAKIICEKRGVWMQNEADCDKDPEKIRDLTHQLVCEGYLFRKRPGVYCIDPNTSDETIIRELYLERQGNRIGVYYDEFSAYHAGILKQKPEVEYILCVNVEGVKILVSMENKSF